MTFTGSNVPLFWFRSDARKKWETLEKFETESFVFGKKIGSNTKIGLWFRFPISKPGIGCTF